MSESSSQFLRSFVRLVESNFRHVLSSDRYCFGPYMHDTLMNGGVKPQAQPRPEECDTPEAAVMSYIRSFCRYWDSHPGDVLVWRWMPKLRNEEGWVVCSRLSIFQTPEVDTEWSNGWYRADTDEFGHVHHS